jgi:hypothetical protein
MLTVLKHRTASDTTPTPEMVVAPLASAGGEVGMYAGAMLYDGEVSEGRATPQGW